MNFIHKTLKNIDKHRKTLTNIEKHRKEEKCRKMRKNVEK